MEDMEAIGPFASWANAKTEYGAKGDGVTDDTDALQRALNDLGKPGKAFVLFLPAGTYRITHTLVLTGAGYYQGVEIIGQGSVSVKIVWHGAVNGTMLQANGGVNTRFSRLTWDGNGTAQIGVAHWWNKITNPKYFGASVEHSDEVFQDMAIGIMAGRLGTSYGMLDSEGQIRRVTFLRNSEAGFDIGSWNALNWWIWDSHFEDCARGVSNIYSISDSGEAYGAGGFHVYRSFFERSTVADFNIRNTQWFGLHNNTSIGSRRFIQAEQMGLNSARMIVENNRIVDTTDPTSIYVGNLGPLVLLDNQIRSTVGVKGPVVLMDDEVAKSGRDVLSIGNSFTVANPIAGRDSSDRLVSISDKTVAASQISTAAPTLPMTPAWASQEVFEVAAGSSTAAIQAVINKAAASGDANPIVHFLPGTYVLTMPLTVPAKAHIQLAGDGWGTILQWKSNLAAGSMLKLLGPSYATVRDLQFISSNAQAIDIGQADQVGGRVLVVGSTFGPVTASGLTHTSLEFQATPGMTSLSLDNVASVNTIGNGGLGPVDVSESNALISDTWYEGNGSDLYRIVSGTFTYLGGNMAPADPNHPGALSPNTPAISLSNFTGTASFVGFNLDLSGVPSGIGIQLSQVTAATNAFFLGLGNKPNYLAGLTSSGSPTLYLSKEVSAAGPTVSIPNEGASNSASVLKAFAQARSLSWETAPYAAPADATNVRIYRVKANQVASGLLVTPEEE